MKQEEELLDALAEKLQSQPGKRLLVIISGPSCSGKTFLTEWLRTQLPENFCAIVPLDAYFKDKDDSTLPREGTSRSFDQLASFNGDMFRLDIKQLIAGKAIHLPCYDLSTNTCLVGKGSEIQPNGIVIAEGIYASHFLRGIPAYRIYISIEYDVAVKRRIERDTVRHNVTADAVIRMFNKKVWPLTERVAQQASEADLIIENNIKEN